MDLLYRAPLFDHYAFCDQDDIWLEDKLLRAVEKIGSIPTPALYISETQPVDQDLNVIAQRRREFNHTFGEGLITNPSTGCTNLMNRALREVVITSRPTYLTMHDSWVYLICKAIGGYIYHDKESYILYRQHGNNVIGSSSGHLKQLKRKLSLLKGECGGERSRSAKELLSNYHDYIKEGERELLGDIAIYQDSILSKCRLLFSPQLSSSSLGLNLATKAAILLNKF